MLTAFLDRDGVINRKLPGDYVTRWEEFEFLPGVFDAMRSLRELGFRLIVVSNQRGVSIGRPAENELLAIHRRMVEELHGAGADLDAIYYCPHDYDCQDCRKPASGLFLRAHRDFPEIKFSESFVIGDSVSDMEAGARLGAKIVLISEKTPEMVAALSEKNLRVDFWASTLRQAVSEYLLPQAALHRRGAISES